MLTGFEPPRPAVVAWGRALRGWLRDSPRDARALTAYGGFLECLISRLSDSGGYQQYADEFPPIERGCVVASIVGGRHDYCFGRVRKVYGQALEISPGMEEARLRLAGLHLAAGGDDGKAGHRTLQDLADHASSRTVRYLANLHLGTHELARPSPDLGAANGWFEAAADLNPDWVSARLGLAATAAREGRIATTLDLGSASGDPWYSYPCRVLDPETNAALAARMSRKP
jgi:hypothetical protein